MNERMIQNALYQFRTSHSIIVPNIHMRWGESDLLTVARSGYVYDHEIKVSKADFKADFGQSGNRITSATKLNKHDAFGRASTFTKALPNYFMYVVPEGLVTPNEVPAYAGLLYWQPPRSRYDPFGTIVPWKKPPRLHDRKVTPDTMEQIARSLMLRFWHMRQTNDVQGRTPTDVLSTNVPQ